MLRLSPTIERIKTLLAEDTDASVTYAALEARLALEKVCYDRLRQRHDYIAHADLRGWTPRHVINKILQEVDQHVGHTMTIMIGTKPAVEGVKPADDEFVELGTEVGFQARKIAEMWNALSNLALHVRLPENKDDQIQAFGDKCQIRAKVEDVVTELERIAKGTMTFSGLGEEVSFECACGQKNKRRARLLKAGQSVSCFNPECSRSYTVSFEDGGTVFELESVEIPCAKCGNVTMAPKREVLKIDYGQQKVVACLHCNYENRIHWILARADLPPNDESATRLE